MEEKLRALHEECQLARNTMINLSERLRSFSNWPLTGKVSKQAMAEAGWFQVGDLSARHVVTMKELGGWEETDDAQEEVKKRKAENPLLAEKWSPGLPVLKEGDSSINVGRRLRLQACITLGHIRYKIDKVEELQEELRAKTVLDLQKKYGDDPDILDEKVKKFESVLQVKYETQLEQLDVVLRQLRTKCAAKFKVKKNAKNKNVFVTDENDAFLEGKWDTPWVELVQKHRMPHPVEKSRQSILSSAGTANPAGPPSAKKATRSAKTSQHCPSIPSIPE